MSSLLIAARSHRILTAVLITGVALAALEIPYLVLARSDRPLGTLSDVGAPQLEDRPAPPFVVPKLDARGTIGVGGPRARVTVLNFWASWCTACRAEAADLETLWGRARGAVRFSLGRFNTADDVERVLEILPKAVETLRRLAPASRAQGR